VATYLAALPFVHPALAVAGVACGAIPVLIHLLNRRRFRRVPWAAMTFLLAANRRSARRIWIEQWLLLAVRVLLVLLLGWAIARPYLPMSALFSLASARLHHVIVLDNSGSMNAVGAAGASRFTQARQFAQHLLATIDGQDAVSLVTLAEPAQAVIAHAAYDHRFVREQLLRVEPTHRTTDVSTGLRIVSSMLGASDMPPGNHVVYVLSDFSRHTWIGEEGQATPAATAVRALSGGDGETPVDVHLVQLASEPTANLTVSGLTPESSLVGTTLPVRLDVTIANAGARTASGATFQLQSDGDVIRREVLPALEPGGRLVLPVTTQFTQEGDEVLEARVVPADRDALHADNSRHLAINVRAATPALLVDGRTGVSLIAGQAGYLATALSPWSAPRRLGYDRLGTEPTTPVAATVVSSGEMGAEDFSAYDVIALCNVSRLSKELWAQLTAYVDGGGGLLLFGGDAVDLDNYNRFGHEEGRGVLPGRFSTPPAPPDAKADVQLELTRPPHPLVKEFADHEGSGLFRARVDRYLPLVLDARRAEAVLNYSDGAPALVVQSFGDGRFALFTTSPDMAWTNLPAKGDYVSLMYRLVAHLTRDRQSGRNQAVGGELFVRLTAVQSSLPLEVRAPDGFTAAPDLVPQGDTLAARYGPLEQPGFYRLSIGTDRRITAVNVPVEESRIDATDATSLERVTGLPVRLVDAPDARAVPASGARATELSRATGFVVLAILFFEAWLAMWLIAGRDRGSGQRPHQGRRRVRTS